MKEEQKAFEDRNEMKMEITDNNLEQVTGGYQGPCMVYIVKWGDTLNGIANAYHTNVKVLMEINCLTNPDKIYAGQKILVPFIG